MSSQATVRFESDDFLYRKMKVTKFGVMLLIRLYADLSEQPVVKLKSYASLCPDEQLIPHFEIGSRLEKTISWLTRQFGSVNTVRAIRETSVEILESCIPTFKD